MLEDIGKFCRERQPFCHKATPVPQIALVYPSKAYQKSSPVPYSRPLGMLQGSLDIVLDGQNSVEILMEHNLSGRMDKYPLIIIPECDYLDPLFKDELTGYVENGGNLLIIGAETAQMFGSELGIKSAVKSSGEELFISADKRIGSVRSDILKVELNEGSVPMTRFYKGSDFSYPDQTIASSMNNYGKGKIAAVYFNAGTSYNEYKTFVIRDFVNEIIYQLMPEKVAEITGSPLVHVAVNKLNGKVYVNLINVAGNHQSQNTIGYDEVPPLKDIQISLRSENRPESIILQPEGKRLKFKYLKDRSIVQLPELKLHSILEIN
jgi:hypothetical protein